MIVPKSANHSSIFHIHHDFNTSELTENYAVDFFTPSPTILGCSDISLNGEERIVYLVNKQDAEEEYYQYIIDVPKISIGITQILSFVLLLLLTHNIKYRRFTPCPFNFIFAIFYSVFLFVTVYIEAYVDD